MKKVIKSICAKIKKGYFKYSSKLVNKLVLLFSTVVLLVIVLQTLYSYQFMKAESVNHIVQSNYSNLEMVNNNIRNYLLDTERFTTPQLNYGSLMTAISEANELFASNIYIEDYIRNLFYSKKDVEAIYLHIIDNNKCIYIVRNQNINVRVNMMYQDNIQKRSWFRYLIDSGESTYLQPLVSGEEIGYTYDKNNCFLAHHRAFREISNKECKAVITVIYNTKIRDEILKDIPLGSGEKIVLSIADQPLYYSDDIYRTNLYKNALVNTESNIGNNFYNFELDSKQYMIIYNASNYMNLRLAKIIPFSEINRSAKNIMKVNLTIGLVFFAFSLVLVVFSANAISKPLKKLTKYVTAFGDGQLHKKFQVCGNDEIAGLATQFNIMITKIEMLINSEYKLKLAEKNAVLKALEAEINPHFLYNALQAISTKALKSGADDVYDMINALALIFRYCISGQDIVEIADERNHIENYLTIQKARFGDRLMVTFEIADDALNVHIPKLSIQTLVENSIKHAIELTSKPVEITIRCYVENDKFIAIVKDNGPGISEDNIEKIKQSFIEKNYSGNSIGLRNLYSRLKLIYGDKANLSVTSDNDTEICFVIPMEDNNV
ncbi:sensor histidine kinase [Oscillospiraceae bacterium PP1C4]